MTNFDHHTYLSPMTWRYGSEAMRTVFSQQRKFHIWRQIWVALAQAQHHAGLVSRAELKDLQKQQTNIDISRILEIEQSTRHDVVAAIQEFAEKATVGGGKIHLGATSMDVVDNTDAVRIKQASQLIRQSLVQTLELFSQKIDQYHQTVCMGYTHLQPAEPTTLGYRFASYAQDLLADLSLLDYIFKHFKAKGMKGAVGTRASYGQILKGTRMTPQKLDQLVMEQLGLNSYPITTQVYPRKQDFMVLVALSGVAASLSKFAADVRILSTPAIGEWQESFGKTQVGSSAMPFKKNPINSEKVCSLARYVAQLPAIAWENSALSHLERTLDDSANKRVIMAEAFLAVDELLITTNKIISGLVINLDKINYNLNQYGPFAATEALIIEAVKNQANRQQMHEVLRKISLKAWAQIQAGQPNPMKQLLISSPKLKPYLSTSQIENLLQINTHIGDAPARARQLSKIIRATLNLQ